MARFTSILAILLVSLACAAILLGGAPAVAGQAAGLLLAFALPGAALMAALPAGMRPSDTAERLVLAFGFSLALATLCFWLAAQVPGLGVISRWLDIELLLIVLLCLVALWHVLRSPPAKAQPAARPPVLASPLPRLGYLALVLVAACALRFPSLGYGEFDKDELDVVQDARSTLLGQTNVVLSHRKGPTEIWLTAIAAGTSMRFDEATVRLPFALASLGAIAATVLVGEEFLGKRRGLLAGLLLSGEGIFLGFSRMAQYQGVVLLMVVLSAWCALRFWRAQERRAETFYLAAGVFFWAAAVFTHWDGLIAGAALAYVVWEKWLAPGAGGLKGNLIAYIAGRKSELLRLALIALAAFLIPAIFYLQLFLNPQVGRLQDYASGRIGLGIFNSAPDFLLHVTFYDASPFIVAVLLLATLLMGRHLPRGRWLLLGAMALPFVWPAFLQIGPLNFSLFLFALALILLLASRTATVPEKVLFLWLFGYFMAYAFVVRLAGLHFYTLMPALMLLAAVPLTASVPGMRLNLPPAPGLKYPALPALARLLPVAASALLLLLAYAYDDIAYVREQPEYALDYPRTAIALFPTLYTDRPRDFFFGFPYRYGWSTIGALYQRGILRGKFESNDAYLVTDWYVRDVSAASGDPMRYFFRVDDAPRGGGLPADLDEHFHPWGEVRVHGQTKIRIYENNQYPPAAAQIFQAEDFPSSDPNLLARSLVYRQAQGDDRTFRELGSYLDKTLSSGDVLVLDTPLQDGIVPYYYRGAAHIVTWPAGPNEGEAIGGAPLIYASLWSPGESERWLAQHAFPIESRWFGSVRLATYAPPIGDAHPTISGAHFGDAVRLESYDVAAAGVRAGGVLRVALQWQATRPLATRYKVFVHIMDAQGNMIAQRDAEPMADLAPTTTWKAGVAVADLHGIRLPANTPPQPLRVTVGLYDPATNERLPVHDANGALLPDGELLIGDITTQ